jgi:hypothetical protein
MEAKSDVVVVSAFGQGHWLAAEVSAMGLKTTMIEASASMGRWTPEDAEGPFGLFHADYLPQSFLTRLHEEDYLDNVEEGFVVWLKEGPVDVLGPNASHFIQRYGLEEIQEYILRYESMDSKEREKAKNHFLVSPFKKSWWAHLAHQLGSPVYQNNWKACRNGDPLSLFSNHSVRRVSRRGFEKSLDWVKSKGVRILQEADLQDMFVESKVVKGLEVKSAWSGVVTADQFIWCFSSAETARFPERFSQEFFYGKQIDPSWSWMRFRVQLKETELNRNLPKKFLIIEDVSLPWTHANLLWVQSTVTETDFDVWLKLPYSLRFQRSYIETKGEEVLQILRSKIPQSEPKILNYPQEYLYNEQILGVSRYPIYDEEALSFLKRKKWQNLYYDGPELWSSLDWCGRYKYQKQILEKINHWKKEREEKRRKLELNETKREMQT